MTAQEGHRGGTEVHENTGRQYVSTLTHVLQYYDFSFRTPGCLDVEEVEAVTERPTETGSGEKRVLELKE